MAAVGIATSAAWFGYRRVRSRMRILRESLELYRTRKADGVDEKTAAAEMAAYRDERGLRPDDVTWDDVRYLKTLITYLVSRSAAVSAAFTVSFFVAGTILSTLGSIP